MDVSDEYRHTHSPPLSLTLQSRADRTLENAGYCVLSLDGGGVRGLSTLYILRHIMNRLNKKRRENGLVPKKPCEIFDLIGGTSTGGYVGLYHDV
jgi:patatin-like phospholipase/acyl hydrolase